jgi:hypothetical protein
MSNGTIIRLENLVWMRYNELKKLKDETEQKLENMTNQDQRKIEEKKLTNYSDLIETHEIILGFKDRPREVSIDPNVD